LSVIVSKIKNIFVTLVKTNKMVLKRTVSSTLRDRENVNPILIIVFTGVVAYFISTLDPAFDALFL